jgi:hypothetical protein
MDHPGASTTLRAIFDLARQFGLSEDEVWRAIDDVVVSVGREATVAEYLDELSGALASRILTKQRLEVRREGRVPAKRRRSLSGVR